MFLMAQNLIHVTLAAQNLGKMTLLMMAMQERHQSSAFRMAAVGWVRLICSGNVWEWVLDSYDRDYYGRSPSTNPTGPEDGEFKVLRGWGWFNARDLLNASFRGNDGDP